MSYTVLNSAMSSTLLSDPEVAGLFSADADLVAMLDFEAALAEAEAEAARSAAPPAPAADRCMCFAPGPELAEPVPGSIAEATVRAG